MAALSYQSPGRWRVRAGPCSYFGAMESLLAAVFDDCGRERRGDRRRHGLGAGAGERFGPVTMAVSVLRLMGTVYLFRIIPTGFLPNEDTGRIQLSTEAAQGISFEEMSKHHAEISRIVNSGPNTLPSGGFVANGSSNRGRCRASAPS